MNRFRKKSDAKRSPAPSYLQSQHPETHAPLPELPPATDFRTSLILPDLSRRFSLLRSSSGDPVSLEDLRIRLAEQRARGAKYQITEEEENMIFETLGRMRSKNSAAEVSQENMLEGDDPSSGRQSFRSTTSSGTASLAPSSVTSSPGGRSGKRYSNNLFGSGRFRDYTYMRSVASSQSRSGSVRANSITPTESSVSLRENTSSIADSLRPVTPEGSVLSTSPQSSPNVNDKVSTQSTPLVSLALQDQALSAAEYRISKTLGPSVLKRASLALEEAIKEIEEEVEDEIVMPRSTPIARTNPDLPSPLVETRESQLSQMSNHYEPGMAISSDKLVHSEPEERRASPVPSRILPGYIPGMPRPMTPRDSFDPEEQRSHSTTPRATSPMFVDPASPIPNGITAGLHRHDSISSNSRSTPRPISPAAPLFLQRSANNGRYTPDDSQRAGEIEFENPLNSSVLSRRRPASPLSGSPYQPMAVSSRPGTPSNVVWNTNPGHAAQKSTGHSRNGSWVSDAGTGNSDYGTSDRNKTSRTLRSPALPDSPLFNHGHSHMSSFSSASNASSNVNGSSVSPNRPPSAVSGIDLGSPVLSPARAQRSPTPTQLAPRSPASPTFPNYDVSSRNGSRRSSKQNPPSSPFSSSGPFHSLAFSPIANSSRSSLESAGSSYHSWDAERKDYSLDIFDDVETKQPAWHDISASDKSSSSATPGGSPDDDWDPEEIIGRYAGLKKSDFYAIQDKLITVATSAPEGRNERAPSVRRRRPSTSQSNYSQNGREIRIASPPPQIQPPASPTTNGPTSDQYSKASALLNSVVDSINSPHNQPVPTITTDTYNTPTSDEVSPTTRLNRQRDLAHALFGQDDAEPEEPPMMEDHSPQPDSQPTPTNQSPILPPISTVFVDASASTPPRPATPPTLPYQPSRNPSSPRIPPTPEQEAELAREVQKKTDAATIALGKGPSNLNLPDGPTYTGSISRKRVSPHQISTPRLVSASTSVDTIPLRPPSLISAHNSGPSKIGSRFRKLRGTLRTKAPLPMGEEVNPFPVDPQSPPASQTANYDPTKLRVPVSGMVSATETGRFKVPVPVPSPPASAGPGLKGFMARFRGKQRTADTSSESEHRASPQPTSTKGLATSQSERTWTQQQQQQQHVPSTVSEPILAPSAPSPPPVQQPSIPRSPSQETQPYPGNVDANNSIKQLFDAAHILGLDQSDIENLLARSGSTSSKSTDWTLLTRNNSTVVGTGSPVRESQASPRLPTPTGQPIMERRSSTDRRPSMDRRPSTDGNKADDDEAVRAPPNGRSSRQSTKADYQDANDEPVTRKSSVRKQPDHLRRPRDGSSSNAAANEVVRRTIIYPSEGKAPFDLNAIMRKNSLRRRRQSALSVSSRSVHDRVPTPPPPRSPASPRFFADGSPPVPQLPHSLSSQIENISNPSSALTGGLIEKSNSTYDSLYEMYAGENRMANPGMNTDNTNPDGTQSSMGDFPMPTEPGTAVEVLELASGQTIWKIVDGLRDEDEESIYASRASFASEYSVREPNGEGPQIFVKEHGRANSKNSNSSFLSRKKTIQGKQRPETKVFYSTSAQIGRLIENLSQNVDAGSFNFLPNRPPGHSASSSLSTNDINWTVEERLEHMLGSIGTK